MQEINISEKLKNSISLFVDRLKSIYAEQLVSVIFYGSAVSAEFVNKHSNLNFLIVLKDTDLSILKKASGIVRKFRLFEALFLTEDYINSSTDIFPIEFLDMQENYKVVYGKDLLKDILIDTKNLRFQCEHELKVKLIALRQLYLRFSRDNLILQGALLKSFTSVLHISRNILRLKGKPAPYKKELIIGSLAATFPIDITVWQRILSIKNKEEKLSGLNTEALFIQFVKEVEKVVAVVDQL